jgi:hypothetical protein
VSFDGLNRFCVAEGWPAELSPHCRLPPTCFDQFKLADRAKDTLAALQATTTKLKTKQAELHVL